MSPGRLKVASPCLPPCLAELSTSVLVPFLTYQPLEDGDIMKITALVADKQNPARVYMAEDDVVLVHPPISITVSGRCFSVKGWSTHVQLLNVHWLCMCVCR